MLINKDLRYELDSNNVQRTALQQHAGTARFAYNWALERIKNKTIRPNAMVIHKLWNEWKRNNAPWWSTVSKCVPQEAFRNLQKAFESFFKKKTRFPKFKSKKRSRASFRLTGSIKLNVKYVTLPRLGTIKLKEISNVTGRILAATITEMAGKWFVNIRVEQEIVVAKNQGPAIGVDLGIKNLATLSDGQTIEGPKALKKKLSLLRRVNRKFARTQRGSKRRERIRKRLAKLHYKIKCIRSDSLHKLTTMLAKTYGVIGIEDLNVSGMVKNRSLARSISDMGWGEFRRQLEYKSVWYGSELVIHNRFFPSSKTCSNCGEVKESLKLSERVYRCEHCGLIEDRDVNAAKNLCPAVRRVLDVEANSSILLNN
jgi:putative transposase